MRSPGRVSPVVKIILPLCLLILVRPIPVPSGVHIGLIQARSAEEAGNPQLAAEGLRQVVLREPWRTDLWEPIGRAEYSAGRTEQALEALQAALESGRLSAEGRFLMGEIFVQVGDEAAAEASWQAVTSMEQDDDLASAILLARAYERLTELYTQRGDYAGAVEILNERLASPTRSPQAVYLLGLYLRVTAPDTAEPLLLEAANADSSYSSRVQVLRRGLAQYSIAEEPAFGWLMLGRSLAAVDQWELAEQAFRKSIDFAPDYAEAWAFLSEARSHTGGSGIPEMERALSLAPQSPVVNALNALALRRQARYTEALDFLLAAARKEPEEPFWLVEIADTQVAKGDLLAARSYYEQAVELAPKNSTYWQALAMFSVNYNVDIRGLGLPAARQAVMLSPKDPSALDAIGWTLANLDDSATGERFLQQAIEIDPAHASANLHLGQIYLSRQQNGDAYFYLKQAGQNTGAGETIEAETARRLLQRYFGEGG